MLLAHWTYTPDEWKTYVKWTKKSKGILSYLLHFIFQKRKQAIPKVRISPESVWIGELQHHFNSNRRRLKKIDIRDAGGLNILVISYECAERKLPGSQLLKIPIPKGKLKEAIELEMIFNQHIRGL